MKWYLMSNCLNVKRFPEFFTCDKNIERHTPHTIVAWPNPKQWQIGDVNCVSIKRTERSFISYSFPAMKSLIEAEWRIYASVNKHHWFKQWLVVWSAPSHYLNQSWNIVNWILRNKLQWNLNRNSYIFIQENAFENVVWKMAAIFLGLNALRSSTQSVVGECV